MNESTLKLDARQRAMLDEMGVKVWWPAPDEGAPADDGPGAVKTANVPAPVAVAVRAQPARPAVVAPPRPAPAPGPGAVPATASSEAAQIGPAELLYGGVAARSGWLIVADIPPGPDGRHSAAFEGDAGRLLDNMLRALQLHSGAVPVHLMRVHRGAATAGSRCFDDAVVAAEVASTSPRCVLAMGPIAAQSLLKRTEPLGRLRGRVVEAAAVPGLPVVATYHPAYLLRNPADKARAWADLCLAATLLD